MKRLSPLAVRLYLIGLAQLVFLLAPAILFSGPPPFGMHGPPGPPGPPGGPPPAHFGIPPPLLNFLSGFIVIAVGSWLTARWLGGRVEGLVRAEKELLANVSHELRTSLSRIRVAVTLAAEGDTATSRAALADIGTDVAELAVLLDGVFETARAAVEGDAAAPTTFALAREALPPAVIADRAIERFRAHHPKRTIAVDVDVDDALVVADPSLATRALGNLLDNAHKYGPRGTITVRVRAEADDIRYEVEDEGIGIDARELTRVLDPFYRATSGRRLPGVGIGLALVKRIVTSHEGRLAIASTLGRGTTVTIWLPRA